MYYILIIVGYIYMMILSVIVDISRHFILLNTLNI